METKICCHNECKVQYNKYDLESEGKKKDTKDLAIYNEAPRLLKAAKRGQNDYNINYNISFEVFVMLSKLI